MTTRQKPETEQTLDSESRLQIRLWVGHNPLAYVTLCVLIGYWLGRGAGERS